MQLGLHSTNLEQWFPKADCKRITWEGLNADSQALVPEILIQKVWVMPENLFILFKLFLSFSDDFSVELGLKTSELENNSFSTYCLNVNISSIDHLRVWIKMFNCIYKSPTYMLNIFIHIPNLLKTWRSLLPELSLTECSPQECSRFLKLTT